MHHSKLSKQNAYLLDTGCSLNLNQQHWEASFQEEKFTKFTAILRKCWDFILVMLNLQRFALVNIVYPDQNLMAGTVILGSVRSPVSFFFPNISLQVDWSKYSEIPLLRPPKMKTFCQLKTLFAKFKLFVLSFSSPSVSLIRDHLLDSPKGGRNIGILLYWGWWVHFRNTGWKGLRATDESKTC